ncbi:MAG TPA: NYN domain-containing protein [Rhodothermales bacterium]|nr:NYN domain-containing protein [Rhodothermales bacterium]
MPESNHSEAHNEKAVLFIDYANLFESVCGRNVQAADAHDVIVDLVNKLRSKAGHNRKPGVVAASAYADFSEFAEHAINVQQLLYLHGIEPRFVSRSLQSTATEVHLAADAIDFLHTRPDIGTFIFLSGSLPYLPLVQAVQRQGRVARLVLLGDGQLDEHLPSLQNVIVDATDLLSTSMRRPARRRGEDVKSAAVQNGNGQSESEPKPVRTAVHTRLTEPLYLEALQAIDNYFGQYDEIYLTPLLRKLSELFGEDACDPKVLISELEEVGAVYLEKRRGFPYDYTVLLIDGDHPDVQEIQQDWDRRNAEAAGGDFRYDGSAGTQAYE